MRPLALFIAVVAVLPLWIVEFPPIQDLPNHTGRVHVMLDLMGGGEAFGEEYELSLLPLPNVAADLVLLPLMAAFPAQVAGKVFLSLVILLTAWAGFRYLRALGAPEMGWLALPLVWNWFLHMGFLSFVLSVPLALFALAWHREHEDRWDARSRVVFGLLATVLYLAHLSSFAMVVAMVQLRKMRRDGRWRLFVPDPGFIPGVALWLSVNLGERGGVGHIGWNEPEWKLWTVAQLFRSYDPMGGDLVLFGLFVAGVAYAARELLPDRLLAVGVALLCFILLPRSALNGYWVDARVLPFLAYLILATLRAHEVRARRVGIVLTLLVTGWTGWQYARLGPEISEMVRAADALPRGATVMPVTEKAAVGQVEVYHHLVTWTVSRRDTVTPHLFAKEFQHPVRALKNRTALHEYWFKGQGDPDPNPYFPQWNYGWYTAGWYTAEEKFLTFGEEVVTAGPLRIIRFEWP